MLLSISNFGIPFTQIINFLCNLHPCNLHLTPHPFFAHTTKNTKHAQDLLFYSGQLVRIFGIAWSLSLILVESEWRLILRAAPLLDLWIGRGVAQTFMAILTYREAFPNEEVSHMQKSLQLYRAIASASLAGCACVHLLGGMVCMGTIRKARQRREDRLLAAATEFDELERRRRELQVLLGRGSEL